MTASVTSVTGTSVEAVGEPPAALPASLEVTADCSSCRASCRGCRAPPHPLLSPSPPPPPPPPPPLSVPSSFDADDAPAAADGVADALRGDDRRDCVTSARSRDASSPRDWFKRCSSSPCDSCRAGALSGEGRCADGEAPGWGGVRTRGEATRAPLRLAAPRERPAAPRVCAAACLACGAARRAARAPGRRDPSAPRWSHARPPARTD